MTTSLGEQAITDKLLATQIGEATFPVQTAYINNIVPLPVGNLQQVTDLGNVTTNGIIANDVTATGLNAGGVAIQAGGNIVSDTGDFIATGGNFSAPTGFVTATNLTATTGNITAAAGDFVADVGKAEIESNITSKSGNFTADVGDFVATVGDVRATAGNLLAPVGNLEAQQFRATNFVDGGTSQGSPQRPPFTPTIPDMTGKTKGCFWIYDPASPTIQFFIETGIRDCVLNASTVLSFNQYNTANPRRLVSYRIGQKGISPPDNTVLAISVTFDATVLSTDPARICVMVYPD